MIDAVNDILNYMCVLAILLLVKKYVSDLKPSSCDRISQDGC